MTKPDLAAEQVIPSKPDRNLELQKMIADIIAKHAQPKDKP